LVVIAARCLGRSVVTAMVGSGFSVPGAAAGVSAAGAPAAEGGVAGGVSLAGG